MADWLSTVGDYAKRGLQTAADAASGLRYLAAPNEYEQAGNALQNTNSLDRARRGDLSLNDAFDMTGSQDRAQAAQRKAITEGPKIGPRPAFMQVRDALEAVNPLPLIGSAADLLGMDTDITAARDPNRSAEWQDMPTPQTGMTRIGVGENAATKLQLRESLNGLNAARAKQVFSPAAAEAWDQFATAYPRLSAHLSPLAWSEDAAEQAVTKAGVVGRNVQGGYAHNPAFSKVGGVAINPALTTEQALTALRHEGTHAARAARRADRGFNWKQEYDDALQQVGYDTHPEELIAKAGEKSAAARADKIATRDAMREFEKLAGIDRPPSSVQRAAERARATNELVYPGHGRD